MPIYDYYCKDCQHQTEIMQKISDSDLTDCPACGKSNFQRQVSAPRVRFAGSGYYETDEKPKSKQRHIAQSDSASSSDD